MTGFGFFLFLATALYLVDKNQSWAKFWRAMKVATLVAAIGTLFVSAYFYWNEWRPSRAALQTEQVQADTKSASAQPIDFEKYVDLKPWDKYCAGAIREAYPGSYDDLSDVAMMQKIRDKYGDNCPLKVNKAAK